MIRRALLLPLIVAGAVLTATCAGNDREPPMIFPTRAEAMALGPLRSEFTTVNDLRMHALVSLEAAPAGAPAIVLVHGSGLSGQYMIPTARLLTRDFRVYVPDIPGYGDSGDPGKSLDITEMADWLVSWMDAIGLPRASFLGNSFGCQIIAELALRHPSRVERALLQGPTTPPDERSAWRQFRRWRQNQPYNPEWLGDVTKVDYKKAGPWRMYRNFRLQLSDRIEDKMSRIEAPVLVIRGEHDPISHQAFCEMLVQRSRRGSLRIIPGVAHTLVTTAPEPLADVVREYMLSTPHP